MESSPFLGLSEFIPDWFRSRPWFRILPAMIPLAILILVAGFVYAGRNMDRSQLANWYENQGEDEIVEWEASWAPEVRINESGSFTDQQGGSGSDESEASEEDDEKPGISEYAEMLFKRAAILEPSERSRFILAAAAFEKGALKQAEKFFQELAPEDKKGYLPAHAYLADAYLNQYEQSRTAQLIPLIKHHAGVASEWENVPDKVLLAASELYWLSGDAEASLSFLQTAARRDPARFADVAMRARSMDQRIVADQALAKARNYFEDRLKVFPEDDLTRVRLAEVYTASGEGLNAAEKLLREGQKIELTDTIRRGLSEVYRLRFLQSLEKKEDGRYQAQVKLLDMALKLDPTNPRVPEEVARLARVKGIDASQALIKSLQVVLAEGNATTGTHAWLAEAYLIRNDHVKALTHLKQVVTVLPNSTKYLNNLAYVTAELEPENIDKAVEYARRAIMIGSKSGNIKPDFYDTYGTVLSQKGDHTEAVAAFEAAIQLAPTRIDFRERVAEEYRKLGNDDLAEQQVEIIQRLKKQEAEAAKATTQSP